MTTALSPRGKQGALLIAGILMIATTLRVTFTGAAPLLETIRSDYGLSTAQTGLLTTLPLLAFALVSPLAAGIARRFGMERSLFAAMLLICAGIALRSLPSAALLFAGTAIIGCGIALGNVLLPGLIKRDFSQHVARLTGAYSLTMGAAAALGSALVVPLALHGFGWRGALLMLMLFPLLAFLIWLPQWRTTRSANLSSSRALHERGIWRSPLAWQVTLFLGLNSLIYYVIIGWLPTILISHGYSEAQAIIWTLLFGFGSGATMILGLTFIGLRASSAHQAAALSGMAQSVGYLLAACGPPVMGKLHDASGSWYLPLSGVTVLAIIMAIFGLYAGRDREIAS